MFNKWERWPYATITYPSTFKATGHSINNDKTRRQPRWYPWIGWFWPIAETHTKKQQFQQLCLGNASRISTICIEFEWNYNKRMASYLRRSRSWSRLNHGRTGGMTLNWDLRYTRGRCTARRSIRNVIGWQRFRHRLQCCSHSGRHVPAVCLAIL